MTRLAYTSLAPLALAAVLSACASTPATTPPPAAVSAPTPAPAPPSVQAPVASAPQSAMPAALSFAGLAGWAEEDHLAALNAFRAGCGVSKDPAAARVCGLAKATKDLDVSGAKAFIEANFRVEAVDGGGDGLLTAYFAPQYEARMSRNAEFSAPLRGLPADLVVLDLGPFEPALVGKKITGHVEGSTFVPYPDRAEIEATPSDKPLAWMRPEELFFLQIQGSGVLVLPDGRRVRAVFAGTNGKPFVGIAIAMRDKGLLPDNNTSADAIRTWLAEHRGPEADAIMRLNPRYVFFRTVPDDGKEPAGAAGVALPPGRAIAVDPGYHAYGGFYWLDAAAPKLVGAFPVYRRAVTALDTGGAIKGEVRADLYMGSGAVAGVEAGRVRHTLRLYRLTPNP
ncbi:murein transglycosylase A [Caulobacter vibrioides]|uniref:peptidoglycan lytic exotransglycosylase n=2 Tax=Caulobacter vibrioides TaxID=155892 RepID=Q9A226_CAUVC|nr:MltA domain-containing protein [Caulobacter vibrioides]YP_002519229.1 membrane-bound lytic murein transglycosylase A [Caulobacter vibrioides NA1000]AAK25702.1 transglycosylase, putative [Caulobacter vibrioides CB15]ACL97321.1 membrane-bound lytic murein transglycosylase A [Caulobacter vibrioides NA1000]ATC30539.1 murein transglycosylase [Caulobacter vibrioides]QXZ52076.1 murein transglycosylase [Caulobacter vibrioides]